jgi:UDP-GlcNAc:undecaprenyl-phosphate GlcNAc-1-phosphate transferase
MTVFLPLITAFFITIIATPISLVFIRKMGLLDDPKTHKHPASIHTKPVPRGGSIPLFFGVVFTGILFLPITNIVFALFIAALIALITGVLDDKFNISPYLRFLINIICALIVVGSGISIPFITNPLGGILYLDAFKVSFILLSDLIAVFWIVWVMNMLNWSKGVDGQMPGVVAISAVIIGILSLNSPMLDQSSLTSSTLAFIIAGASLGFLIFNFYPAKIFPGYGATAIYLLLSVTAIMSSAKLATAILVMGVPMTDGIFTIFRRLITGRSPFLHDRLHLHHLLLSMGMKQRNIALFYWAVSAILGSIALTLSSRAKLFAIIMLVIVVSGAILFLHYIINKTHGKQNN